MLLSIAKHFGIIYKCTYLLLFLISVWNGELVADYGEG